MRAAGITALGEPVKILEVDELAPPSEDEVLIDVAAAGIGNWDELVRIGSWRIGGPAPMALGTEAAGTVAAVGSGVAEVCEGDEVIFEAVPGDRTFFVARAQPRLFGQPNKLIAGAF
jgi:Zn-dependent alcohol dehydrogenase